MKRCELVLVMPVYNEEACICQVIDAWSAELARLEIDFQILVLNDGSKDGTGERLGLYASNPRVDVVTKENSGHGPTILLGYHRAVERADWVFQVDSDDEMSPAHFHALWRQHDRYDALFGSRDGRHQSGGRKLLSAVSRRAVGILFGAAVTDVNTPYRLIRSSVLKPIICRIPDNTFAPNLLIAGMLAMSGLSVLNVPVPHEGRKTGAVSIVRWRLWKAAAQSLAQTVLFRFRYKTGPIG